jgi:hypothetical protein
LHRIAGMGKKLIFGLVLALVSFSSFCFAQEDKDNEGPTCVLSFVVTKEDNGKPVRNAAVIMHPVNPKGKQIPGGEELKTDVEGKTNYDGIPYGMLRVQVLAQGFQTYGEDFDINQPKMEITIKLKRPRKQYSIYDDSKGTSAPPRPTPQQDQK